MAIIYILRNKINNKKYVGQTTGSFKKRLNKHIKRSKQAIDKAIKKYDIKNFDQFIFSSIPEFLLDYFETELISRLNSIAPNGYNLESGGNKNKHHHEETKNKLSEINKGKFSGKNHPMYGKKLTEDSKRKISNSRKNKYNGSSHYLSRKVYCIELDKTWNCLNDASKELGVTETGISNCCNGKRKTSHKLHWKFLD